MMVYTDADYELLTTLAHRFENVPKIIARVKAEGSQTIGAYAMEIAHSLLDIRESMQVLYDELVPRLCEVPPDSEEYEDILDDIGDEYQHVLYHLLNTSFFSYVVPYPILDPKK